MNNQPVLEVKNLKKYFNTPKGMLHAVDGISFEVFKGHTLGMVGESGCGKTTAGRTILRLIEPSSGEIKFKNNDISKLSVRMMKQQRKDMQIIFQDPFSSLNPRLTVSQLIEEPLIVHKSIPNKKARENRVDELMETVGLAHQLRYSFPHELDGGRRQRIGVARAIALEPSFIVCDEPVSALDVSIQAQILNLMKELQNNLGLTYLFITHNLSVVYHFSDDIVVMYLGKFMEKAPSDLLFSNPRHPYTQALLSAITTPDLHVDKNRIILKGELPTPIEPAKACRFANRCIHAMTRCFEEEPEFKEIEQGHYVSCFLMD